ncbi:MAG: GerMN domain-containing protein, partial [Pontimonas sp.]
MRKVFLPLLMGLVTMVASCTAIPSSGPVISAQIEATTSSVDVDFLPPGPSAGATPEEIVAGFIAAGAAAQDNYRVAKSYLSESVRDEWNPNAGVIIRSGEPDISAVTNNTAQYVVLAMASVDELGRYFEGASSAEQALDFRFTKELGEWRLSAAPDGVVLTESAFSEAFHSYRLYYFSAGYRELVADVRWFATRGEVSAKIVRALLEAPSFWLEQGATVSAFPEGTQLALTPIPVVDGVARVDLTTAVVSADELTRSRMIAQLTASLTQVQGISTATISVNQNELLIPTLGEDGPTLITGRDPRLAVVKDRRFGFIQARKVELIEPLAADIATLDAQNVFYSATFGQALVNRSDGLWRVDGVSEPVLIDPRVTGVRAIMDNCGLVWSSASQSGPEMLTIVDQNG